MNHPSPDIKRKVVEAYKDGNSITHLSQIFGFHRNSIRTWVKLYKINPKLLAQKKPGRGRPGHFEGEQGKKLLTIITQPASSFGFETDLWTTPRLKQVCKEKLKLTVSRMSIHRALKKFKHTYKKTQTAYYEACKKKQAKWVKEDLVEIKSILKRKRAILYFEDETSIDLSPVAGKTWGPIGKKTIQKVTANRGSISAISALSSTGGLLFNVHSSGKRYRAADIVKFLSEMLKHHLRRHLVVVMDQAPCHRAKRVKQFVDSQKRLHVFYLPPRSPEYNPDEKVWSHLKNHELKAHQAKTTEELLKLTKEKMKSMASDSKKMRGVFKRCDMSAFYL